MGEPMKCPQPCKRVQDVVDATYNPWTGGDDYDRYLAFGWRIFSVNVLNEDKLEENGDDSLVVFLTRDHVCDRDYLE